MSLDEMDETEIATIPCIHVFHYFNDKYFLKTLSKRRIILRCLFSAAE